MSSSASMSPGPSSPGSGDGIAPDHDSHGSTPAAWTAVVIVTLAFTLGTLAIILGNWPLFWISVGLVVLGAIVGKVMQAIGLGKHGTTAKPAKPANQ